MTATGKRDPTPTHDPGKPPGYAERQPRDREEAQRGQPEQARDPDAGGLDREPEGSPDPAGD